MSCEHEVSGKHLRVFEDRSEYHRTDGNVEVFLEGVVSGHAKQRAKVIKDQFQNGFLDSLIEELKVSATGVDLSKVSNEAQVHLKNLVELVTSEVGRALIGLTVMQLCIKAIAPDQCIRLHKASANKGTFSWAEGISMRTLDKSYVTPILRKHNLVKLNADGFMMTRSLAENYPYSDLYKAQLRGAREDWLLIVDELELQKTDPLESLKYLLSLLLNSANEFEHAANVLIRVMQDGIHRFDLAYVRALMKAHADSSDYAARLLEISMHALMQAAVESGALGDVALKPLSQMRSANKKHGNIGDVELLEGDDIIESWDGKYGKSYLREEIEEACEKIVGHDHIQVVGFVTNTRIQEPKEIRRRLEELEALHGIRFVITDFDDWSNEVIGRCIETRMVDESYMAGEWLSCYVLSLAQKKRGIAPIDEPCMEWVKSLTERLGKAG
jgi:hypothetical protein